MTTPESEREQLISKLSDTMDPDGARDFVDRVIQEAVSWRLEALGRAGFTISICCGPCGADPFRWTVQAMNARGQEFDQPFAANSFAHAIEIAELEITKRGWR